MASKISVFSSLRQLLIRARRRFSIIGLLLWNKRETVTVFWSTDLQVVRGPSNLCIAMHSVCIIAIIWILDRPAHAFKENYSNNVHTHIKKIWSILFIVIRNGGYRLRVMLEYMKSSVPPKTGSSLGEKFFRAPQRGGPAKNIYSKPETLTLSCRVTWIWSERINM